VKTPTDLAVNSWESNNSKNGLALNVCFNAVLSKCPHHLKTEGRIRIKACGSFEDNI